MEKKTTWKVNLLPTLLAVAAIIGGVVLMIVGGEGFTEAGLILFGIAGGTGLRQPITKERAQ